MFFFKFVIHVAGGHGNNSPRVSRNPSCTTESTYYMYLLLSYGYLRYEQNNCYIILCTTKFCESLKYTLTKERKRGVYHVKYLCEGRIREVGMRRMAPAEVSVSSELPRALLILHAAYD